MGGFRFLTQLDENQSFVFLNSSKVKKKKKDKIESVVDFCLILNV